MTRKDIHVKVRYPSLPPNLLFDSGKRRYPLFTSQRPLRGAIYRGDIYTLFQRLRNLDPYWCQLLAMAAPGVKVMCDVREGIGSCEHTKEQRIPGEKRCC